MVKDLYQKSFSVLMKRPFRLWGLSLLAGVLLLAAQVGFVGVPAVAFCAALLLGVVLLCGVAESFFTAAEQPSVPRFVPMAGALAITLTAAGDLQQMMGLGVETMEELDVFAKALLPTLSAAAAASGGAITAGTRQVATVFFANLLLSVIRKLLLPLLCGVFLVESFSVMMQVGWFKYTKRRYGEGRRILLMSPVHHHYQKKGIFETKIVLRFWIISLLLAAITLVTLKIR